MNEERKPIMIKTVKLKPRGVMSWVVEHVRPSLSILPPKDGKEDDFSIHNFEDAWDFVKNRVEFKIGLTFKF